MMNRGAVVGTAYGGAGVGAAKAPLRRGTWPSAAAAARLRRAVTAGLITLLWFAWVLLLLWAAGELAGLFWRLLPRSLVLYLLTAAAAAVALGWRYGQRPPRARTS